MPILLESQESSSPIITRAVAQGLLNKTSDNYRFSWFEKLGLRVVGYFPKQLAEWIVPRANTGNVLAQQDVIGLRTSDLVLNRLNDYKNNSEKFPAITVGVGMGGTTAHLALALHGPFLPQAFVVTLKNGTMNGNVREYFELTNKTARTITDNNPDIMTIQHYDPIHDGWLVKRVNHLRFKLVDLPEEYKQFIRTKLVADGDVVYLEGNAKWKRFRTGDRNVFQVGGWGDISVDEFLFGSKRVEDFARKENLDFSHWMLDGFPMEEGPESEWGSEEGLGEALEMFCKNEGFNFTKISYDDPNNFSKLAFMAKKELLENANIDVEGVIVEMFSQFDTSIVDGSALLPLWLIFNTLDSKRFLESMVDEFPKHKIIFFSGLATFSNTPDLVPWKEWQEVFKGFEVINIGSRKDHYPSDTHALLDWKKPLQKWADRNPSKFINNITAEKLAALSKQIF